MYELSITEIKEHNLPENFNSLNKLEKVEIIKDRINKSIHHIQKEYYLNLLTLVHGLIKPGNGL